MSTTSELYITLCTISDCLTRLSLEQPCKLKSMDVALIIPGVVKYARKTCNCSQSGGNSNWVLNERSTSDSGNSCPLWFVILKSVWNSIEITFSCHTVRRELLWAILCSLLSPEMDWNIRIREQGYVFILRSNVLMFRIPDINQCVNTLMLKLRKVKALANEDTLLRTHHCRHKCFPVCPHRKHLLRTQILCSGHKKCIWFCSETFCVRNKCFPVCAAQETVIMSNNVSATMCPQQCVLICQGL